MKANQATVRPPDLLWSAAFAPPLELHPIDLAIAPELILCTSYSWPQRPFLEMANARPQFPEAGSGSQEILSPPLR